MTKKQIEKKAKGRDSEINREEQRIQEEEYYQEMYNRYEQEMQQMFEEGGEK